MGKHRVTGALLCGGVALFSLSSALAAKPGPWKSLFDGKSLAGWERKAVHGGNGGVWEVKDRVLVGDQEPDHKGGLLGTTAAYGDVEVEAEFKADEPVDSGLFLRTNKDGGGYQVTIDNRQGGSVGSLYVPGAGFVAEDPDWRVKFKAGDWNRLKAAITGGEPGGAPTRITVFLNGKKTVDFTETKPGRGGIGREGYVGLQVHGGGGSWGENCRVRFRSVRVRSLDPQEHPKQ